MMVRSVVVFPAPFRPTRQTTSCAPTWSETSPRMRLLPMSTQRRSTVSIAHALADDGGDHLRVGEDAIRGRIREHAAFVQRDDAAGVAEDDVHIVLDLDDRLDPDATSGPDEHVHDRSLV